MLLFRIVKCLFLKCCGRSQLIHDLFVDPDDKRNVTKKCLLCIYGNILGILLYKFVLLPIDLPVNLKYFIASVLCILFGLGCAFSVQFRCISFLIWFEFGGKVGRNVIKTVIIGMLLTGPINNIIRNSMEVTRVFVCSTQLTFNLTKTKLDLATKPFINAFMNIDKNLSSIQDNFRTIDDVLKPIFREIEGNGSITS